MTRDLACKEAVERLWAYLDHELDEADGKAVEQHLSFCLQCCGELEFAREVRSLLAGTSRPEMPETTRQHLEAFIDSLDTADDTTRGRRHDR